MVLMQGSTRVLNKPLNEQSGSTSQSKLLSIYGITSYNELLKVPLDIICTTGSSNYISVNINSLGVKSIKYQGILNIPTGIINTGSIYTIVYDGTDFILQGNSSSSNSEIINIPDTILSLTDASTSSDITTAFGGAATMLKFMNSLESTSLMYIVGSNGFSENTILKISSEVLTENNVDTQYDKIQVILPDTKKLKTLTFSRQPDAATYDEVHVIEENLGGSNITVENDLTSDSQVNPPSVHAVNQALGQINAILNQILNS